MFKKNDYVLITDRNNPYFLRIGKIDIIQDGTIVVIFQNLNKYGGNDFDNVTFDEYELSIISKTLAFK